MPDLKSVEAVKKSKFIYLTTKGRKTGNSHTVELWFAFADGRIFLSHEGQKTDWMKNLAKNENVSIRIDKVKLDAKARIVGEGSSRELGKKSLYEKYYGPASKEVLDDWFSLSTVVELIPM